MFYGKGQVCHLPRYTIFPQSEPAFEYKPPLIITFAYSHTKTCPQTQALEYILQTAGLDKDHCNYYRWFW